MPKTVLITGGAGFIGSHMACCLAEVGHRAVVLDLRSPGPEASWLLRRAGVAPTIEIGSVTDQAALRQVAERNGVTDVIHLASIVNPVHLAQHPLDALNVNTQGTVQVLEMFRQLGLGRLVSFSTIGVLPKVQYEPIDANHPVILGTQGPGASFYGAAKLASEAFCWAYRQSFGIDFITIRPSAAYGFGQQYPIYIKPMVEGAVRGEPVHFDHGREFPRDYTHVADIAQIAVRAIDVPTERLRDRIFYAATGRRLVTAGEVADLVNQIVPGGRVTIEPGLTDADRIELDYRGILDVEAARQQLGYEPRYADVADGIREYAATYRAYLNETGHR